MKSFKKLVAIGCLFFSGLALASGSDSLIFMGYLRHVVNDDRSHEGNMQLLGYSKELSFNGFRFDTGVNTYVDSYRLRSYGFVVQIGHECC